MTVNSSTIRLAELINDNAALTPNEGDIVFNAIDKSLNQGEQVHVDFKGIEFLTTAFLNAAIGQLYSKHNSLQLRSNLKVENISDADKLLLQIVIERAKQYFADPQRLENLLEDGE